MAGLRAAPGRDALARGFKSLRVARWAGAGSRGRAGAVGALTSATASEDMDLDASPGTTPWGLPLGLDSRCPMRECKALAREGFALGPNQRGLIRCGGPRG